MQCWAYTAPAINYAKNSIVGGFDIFTGTDPVVVYIKNEGDVLAELKRCVETVRHLVILNSNAVSRFWR